MRRRRMLVGSALFGAGVALCGAPRLAAAAQPSLYVFLHTRFEPRALGRTFSEALPGVSPWVLTRSRDFSRVRERNPDAVLALSPVLQAQDFKPALQGHRDGASSEAYVLLAPQRLAPASVRSVGAVDMLGRREMPQFVASLLGGDEPSVTPVTKLADLLALLQLEKVQAVLLPAREAEPLMSRTRLSLTVTKLNSAAVGLPAFCPLTASGERIKRMLTELPASALADIGVDSWR